MTNFEKYKDEILKIATETHDIPAMEDGRLQKCSLTSCEMCKFEDDDRNGCGGNFVKWLYEDDGDDGEEHDGCDGCKYEYKREDESPCTECSNNYTSKWERRPKKTRQDEFLEHYPNAKINPFTGALAFCPVSVDENANVNCVDCNKCKKDYWLQEVEE